jgi:hypothetical protein
VFFKKRLQIDYQVLDNLKKWQWLNDKIICGFKVSDEHLTGQFDSAVDDQSIRAAYAVGAGRPKSQSGILFPSNFVEAVQYFVGGFGIHDVFLITACFINRRVETANDKGAFHINTSFLWVETGLS